MCVQSTVPEGGDENTAEPESRAGLSVEEDMRELVAIEVENATAELRRAVQSLQSHSPLHFRRRIETTVQ